MHARADQAEPSADEVLDNRAYYDAFAKSYEDKRHHGYHALIDELESGLVARAAAGLDVLEVGVGTGLVLDRVAKVAGSVTGMDLSAGMMQKARERGLSCAQGDACALPFHDESFDVVYSFKVLAHVPDLEQALREMARVCRPGGKVFIELYNRWSLRWIVRRVFGGRSIGSKGLKDDQVFVRYQTPPEMERALPSSLTLAGLHGIRVVTLAPQVISLPLVGSLVSEVERRLSSSRLARFGGFLVMECDKG